MHLSMASRLITWCFKAAATCRSTIVRPVVKAMASRTALLEKIMLRVGNAARMALVDDPGTQAFCQAKLAVGAADQ